MGWVWIVEMKDDAWREKGLLSLILLIVGVDTVVFRIEDENSYIAFVFLGGLDRKALCNMNEYSLWV